MKANYIKLFLLLLCGLLISDSIPVLAKEKSWKLIFYDDFNSIGKERFDTTKWIVPDREPYKWSRWISDSKSVVLRRNGKLICRAIPNTAFADSAKMLTGAICTKGKFSFKYGKLEVKMKTNFLPGNFPAVWLLPENHGNPYRYGEIDVVEFFGTDQKSHQTVHSHSSFILGKTEQQNSFAQKVTPNQWHIFGMEWTPAYITMYVDGKITGTFLKSNDSEEVEEGQWTFDRPYYIILNQSVGDESWNTPMLNTIYETEIDWIKVYQ